MILIVGPLPPPQNGMTVMTALARRSLLREDFEIAHLDLSDHRPVGNVGRLDLGNVLLAFRHFFAMLVLLRRKRPRLVYLPIAQSTLGFLRDALLFLAAWCCRVPVVAHLHGASFARFYARSHPALRWVVRACLRDVHAAIVLTDGSRSAFAGLVPPERVHVLPNGIPGPPAFLPRVHDSERFDVLYMSNLIAGKGYRDLIAAIPAAAKAFPSLRVRIAGEWSGVREREETLREVRRLGIEKHVTFLSSVTGIRKLDLFRRARVFVFPPEGVEGQPLVLLEAMSHGLPVIATPMGGIPETVEEGVSGIFVPPGRPDALAAAITRLLGDEILRSRMGQAGRRRFLQQYRVETFQRGLASLLGDGALDGAPLRSAAALAGRGL